MRSFFCGGSEHASSVPSQESDDESSLSTSAEMGPNRPLRRHKAMADSAEGTTGMSEPGDDNSAGASAWSGLADIAAAGAVGMWADADGEVAQFITAEQRSHSLLERLTMAGWVSIECQGGHCVDGQVLTVYKDCVLLDTTRTQELVMLAATVSVRQLPLKVSPPTAVLGGELSAASALARWMPSAVTLWRRDGSIIAGDLTAVWADCADVVNRAGQWSVPFWAIAAATTDVSR